MASPEIKNEPILSRRGNHTASYEDFLLKYLDMASENAYHPLNNPKGIIDMGTATNSLMEEELISRITEKDCLSFTHRHVHYSNFSGVPTFKEAVASFLTRHLKPFKPIIQENLTVLCGATACSDALGHLICDPGDVIITTTPVYGRTYTDVHNVSQACVELLHLSEHIDENGESFQLDPEDLERRIVSLRRDGKRVRAFFILHPHNPLGDVQSPQLMKRLLDICAKHEVHFISDEVYALSVFDEKADFKSVLSFDVPDPSRTHCIWAFSKDFGLAGFRIGVICSLSQEVVKGLSPIAAYKNVPQVVQDAAAVLLNDKAWCDEFYLPNNIKRLREAYQRTCNRLQSFGIQVRKAQAGVFVWLNVQPFLKYKTEEEEMKLLDEFMEVGLYINPGTKLFCSTPGWFRLIFAINQQDLNVGLDRLELVLKARREGNKK